MIAELKRVVVKSGVSCYRVSQRTNGYVSQSELSRWFKGKLNLGPAKLDAVAEAVGAKVVLGD
jgi:hypothetical protein